MKNKILRIFTAVLLLTTILVVTLSSYKKKDDYEDNKPTIQEDLNKYAGSYDIHKIVLQNTNEVTAKKLAERFNAKLRITSDGSYATLTLPDDITINDIVKSNKNRDILSLIAPDYKATLSELTEERTTNFPTVSVEDEYYDLQTYLKYLNLQDVWKNYKGSGKTIAVIDTGIDTDHPEFAGRISEYSYNATLDKIVKDCVNEDGSYDWSIIEDEQGHGTAVSGVIAASMNNEIGIAGIAPEAKILTIKAECDKNGNFKNTSDLVFGLYYAIEQNVDVVNMSFGSPVNVFSTPAKLAVDSDIVCIAAAGNESTAKLTYPAADENVIGVGALADNSWELASYSNYGDNTDVVAPGTVYTTYLNGTYKTMSGTSFSAPIVSSLIALFYNHYMTTDYAKEVLYAASYDLESKGKDFYFGYGAVDASALILEEKGTVTFNYLTDEINPTTQIFIKNHPLQNIPQPERLYSVFDGWYYDINCKDEIDLYVDAWTSDLTLYCSWGNEDDVLPYTYTTLDDNSIEITSYIGKRKYITIPEYIDNKKVTSIGRSAFANNTKLVNVNLPSGLKSIKDYAFDGCINIKNFEIPSSVISIGINAFRNNISLYNINFLSDSKLEVIDEYAFINCSSLTRFDIPKNVKYNEENNYFTGSAFVGCTNLRQVNASRDSKYLTSINGVLYNKASSTIILYPAGLSNETYDLPTSVTKLGKYSFAFSNIDTIDLKNVTAINSNAFESSRIRKITLSDKVTTLGSFAFINSQINDITLGHGLKALESGTFRQCNNLYSITIPNSIVYIRGPIGAFFESSLTDITFEEESKLLLIDDYTFANSNLHKIEIPSSVVKIGMSAFYGCSNLTEVIINNDSALSVIDENAFSYTSIKTINLTSHLYTIGAGAFFATKLEEVTIPSSVNQIYGSSFAGNIYLKNIFVSPDNKMLTSIDGVVYTKDYSTLFAYPAGKDLSSYTIDGRVTEIGEYAFYGACNLTSIDFPENLIIINDYAFSSLSNISYYNLPSSLTSIGEYAFSDNEKLQGTTIPGNVETIGRYAFKGNYNCININITTPSKLDRLPYGVFAYTGIYSFRIPSSISSISQDVFLGCNNLDSITFEENSKLQAISAYTFSGCDQLRVITFENGSNLETIEAHAFEGLKNLTTIDFGDASVKTISNYAFRFCTSLQNITLPETLTFIGRYAFYGCKSLTKLTIPSSVDYIGRYAFNLASSLDIYFESDTLPSNIQEYWDKGINSYHIGVKEIKQDENFEYAILRNNTISIIKYLGNEKTLDLTNLSIGTVSSIGGHAFMNSSVESIVLPETLIEIQYYAFKNSRIKTLIIPDSVIRIGNNAFEASSIETITINETSNLKYIDQYAFSLCTSLKSIYLPSSLIKLGTGAFEKSSLETVNFDENITINEIPEDCFLGTKLVNVVLPNTVTLINNSAFREVETLLNITFGTSKLSILSNAFYNSGLQEVYLPENIEYVGEYSFVGLKNLKEFKVSENNKYYQQIDGALYTKDGKKIIAYPAGKTGSITLPTSIETIGFGAFENSSLTNIEFGAESNILNIGYRAFFNAKNLVEITIPDSVISIDYYAFANCDRLESVNISENSKLAGIYEGAFYGCINLKYITLPDTLYVISDYCFSGCSSLTRIPVNETSSLIDIASYAFAYSGLTEVNIPLSIVNLGAYSFKGIKATTIVIPSENQEILKIGIGAFEECEYLEEITLPFIGGSFEDETNYWVGYVFGAGTYEANEDYLPDLLKKITIDEGIKVVKNNSFYNIKKLEEIDLPYSLELINAYAFYLCESRHQFKSSISLSGDFQDLNMNLGSNLYGTLNITSFVTSLTVEKIQLDCYDLTSVSLPATKRFPYFKNCNRLQEIIIPEGTEIIADDTCNSSIIKEITLPSSLKYIYDEAFGGSIYIYRIINNSSLDIKLGDRSCGWATTYANELIDKDGNKIVSNDDYSIIDYNNFRFTYKDNKYTLVDYLGSEVDVVLPEFIYGTSYEINLQYNRKLEKVEIPNTFTTINEYAFYDCSSLKTVIIPDSIIKIAYSAFSSCELLTNVKLPNFLETIESFSFSGCESITSIVIPNSVSRIGRYAFRDTSIKEITIPNSVKELDGFQDCKSLETVNLPDTDIIIYDEAFNNCENLKYIKLGARTKINGSIINSNDCILDFSNSEIYNYDNGITYDETFKKIIYVDKRIKGEVTIKDGVESISNAFSYCKDVTSIILPDSITSISESAFSYCTSLTTVKMSSKVTNIGSYAFENCTSLVDIELPNTIETIHSYAFKDCTSLITFKIPNLVTSIEDSTFYGCTSLINIEISETVTKIGQSAFNQCSSLQSIAIPTSVTSINVLAFAGCKSLVDIEIPDSVTELGWGIFLGCNSLISVKLPNSMDKIGEFFFEECISLETVDIPAAITSIERFAFNCCISLKNIILPDTVKSIEDSAFTDCISLKNIKMSTNITNIGTFAFNGCVSLVDIQIPAGITRIEKSSFDSCSSLKSITLPDTINEIRDSAFKNCTSLSSITISNNINYISSNAFYGCQLLFTVINNSDLKVGFQNSSDGIIFEYAKKIIEKDGTIRYYNDEELGDLKDTEYIVKNNFKFSYNGLFYILIEYEGNETSIVFPENINGENYFINFSSDSVKEIKFPDNLIELKSYYVINEQRYSFTNKIYGNKLETIDFNNLTKITHNLLEDNRSLENVICNNVIRIEYQAFEWCLNLKSVKFLETLEEIESRAFYNCTSLTTITIPESVSYLGGDSFAHCSNLIDVILPKNIKYFASSTFDDTPYMENTKVIDGVKHLGNYIIDIDKNKTQFSYDPGYQITNNALNGCTRIKDFILNKTDSQFMESGLRYLTNLEKLYININLENPIRNYLYSFPETFKTIIISSSVTEVVDNQFNGFNGVIYVDQYKDNVMWDYEHPNWNGNNKVYYKGEWIKASFYNNDDTEITTDFYLVNQIIRQPIMKDYVKDGINYKFIGWDTDGDNKVNSLPANSKTNVTAKAIYEEQIKNYTVTFMDKDGVTILEQLSLPYGSTFTLITPAEKQGYTFVGWRDYPKDLVVTEDLIIYSVWTHNGNHEYTIDEVIDPTCTEAGYTKHICSICNEYYISDYVDKLGHNFTQEDIVDPTCTEDGYTKHTCSVCDYTYSDNYVNKLGHTFGDYIIDEDPTCENSGLKHKECHTCQHKEEETIAPLGHNYEETDIVESTCTHGGSITYTCTRCEDVITSYTDLKDHEYVKKYVSLTWLERLLKFLIKIFYGIENDNAYYFECVNCKHIMTANENQANSSIQGTCSHETCEWVVVFTSCDDNGLKTYKCTNCDEVLEIELLDPIGHDLVHHEKLDATCEEAGHEAYDTCTRCDYTTFKEIQAAGHTSSDWIIDKKSNCTEDGSKHKECTVCHKVLKTEVIDKLGHNLVHHEKLNPTCEEAGHEAYDTCTRCDYTTFKEIPSTGHTTSDWIIDKESNCTEDGTKHKECTVCHKVLETEVIEKLGHDLVHHEKLDPTCEEVGHEAYDTCTRCDYTTFKEIPSTGHTSSDWIIDKESNCTEDGSKHKECTVCHKILETEVIEKLGHNLVHHEKLDPTCEEAGHEAYDTCTRCDYTTFKEIPATGHRSSDWIIDKESNCTEDGSKHKECTVCHKVLETETIDMLGHDLVHHEKLDSTCEEVGHEEYDTCTRCDYTTFKEIPATGHTSSEWIIDKESNCTEDGSKHKECTVCHKVLETEVIDKLGHDLVHHEKLDPTCEENGHEAYDTCTRCDYTTFKEIPSTGHTSSDWIIDQKSNCTENGSKHKECTVCHKVLETEIISKLGHDLVHHEKQDPTCEEAGHEAYDTCTRCDYTTFKEISATGHTSSEWIIDKESNCTEDGSKHKECTVCHKVLETEVIDKLGHNLVHHEKLDPTCEEAGHEAYDTCTRCDYTTFKEIPATGHTSSDWIIDQDSNCTETGSKHKECTVCHKALETEVIEKLGHDLVHHEKLDPTCEEVGHEAYDTCTRCDYTTFIEIPSTGHTTSEWIVDVEATCTETGSKHKECTVCHKVLETEILEKLGHNLVHHEKLDATCEEVGHEAYDTCTRCDYTTFKEIPSTGHTTSEWIVDVEPTHKKEGSKHKECTTCHKVLETETISKISSKCCNISSNSVVIFTLISICSLMTFVIRRKKY